MLPLSSLARGGSPRRVGQVGVARWSCDMMLIHMVMWVGVARWSCDMMLITHGRVGVWPGGHMT